MGPSSSSNATVEPSLNVPVLVDPARSTDGGRETTEYDWIPIGQGIILAGTAYPLVLVAINFVVELVGFVRISPSGGLGILNLFGGAFSAAFLGGIAGLIWTTVVVVLTTWLARHFCKSLQLYGDIRVFGAVWGGFLGFLAVLPFSLAVSQRIERTPTLFVLQAFAAGPGLTTILGQIGGAWGAKRSRLKARIYERTSHRLNADAPTAIEPPGEVPDGDGHGSRSLRFGIRHLLWITVWVSLVLTVIRVSGIPFAYVLPLGAGWFVYQLATLYVGARIYAWKFARSKSVS